MSAPRPEALDPGLEAFVAVALPRPSGRAPAPATGRPPVTGAETPRPLTWTRLAGDGSTRRIFRASREGVSAVAVANPLPAVRTRPDENDSFLAAREYLHQCGVRVPEVFAADLERGFLLLEDLGDLRLYDTLRGGGDPEPRYREALQLLVRMQIPRGPAFRPDLVANPPYTPEFVVDREARYFHEELVRGLRGSDHAFAEIEPECRRLAVAAVAGAPAASALDAAALRARRPVFLHRDYQSRNLMVTGDALVVIDFQGARLGPPEYDLAALLYDPYASLEEERRERLLAFYLGEASRAGVPGIPAIPVAPDSARPSTPRSVKELAPGWRLTFLANAANRLMQALGAYAKLGGRERRPGFLEHIPSGLRALAAVLTEEGQCPALRELVSRLGK